MRIEVLKTLERRATGGPFHALLDNHRLTGIHGKDCVIYHVALESHLSPETHARQRADALLFASSRNLAPEWLALWEAANELSEIGPAHPMRTYRLKMVETALWTLNAKAASMYELLNEVKISRKRTNGGE